MPIEGLESALRNQTRAAQRERKRTTSSTWSDVEALDTTEACCARCEARAPRSTLAWTEDGEICIACQDESAIAVPVESSLQGLFPAAMSIPAALVAWATLASVQAGSTAALFAGGGTANWMMYMGLAFATATIALFIASRRVRDVISARSLQGTDWQLSLGAVTDVTGFGFTLLVWLATSVCALIPFLV